MSTRSNILIEFGSTRIYLYRHCDGYPAVNGVALSESIDKARNAGELVTALLALRYKKREWDTEARPIYELTTEFHGDIEWAYVVHYPRDGYATKGKPTTIGVSDMEYSTRIDESERDRRLAALPATQSDFSVADFAAFCKHEETEMRKRIAVYVTKRKAQIARRGRTHV